jgi:outer membrane protein TolC
MKQYNLIILLIFLVVAPVKAQESITLEYCYDKIEQEFPLSKKVELQNRITELNTRIRQAALYPEFKISGSASYQSDVTEVPFAGPAAPEFSKDHYSIAVDISQPVFDGGRTSSLKEMEERSGEAAKAGIETELWNVRQQVDQVYFGILLLQKQMETLDLLLEDLNEQLKMFQSRVENGVLLPSNALILKAEILKVTQQKKETESNIRSGREVLGELIGEELEDSVEILLPEAGKYIEEAANQIKRPEYEVFSKRSEVLESQIKTIGADKLPVISAFARTAYARPGLDAFDDDLQFYWIFGVRAQWSFRNWSNASRKSQVVRLQQDQLEADEDAFTRQLEASLRKTESAIEALDQQIELDKQVLELRSEVIKEKKSQLNEGVITSTEYIAELNAENRARLGLEIHQVQLIQAQYEYLTKRGISWK